MAFFFFQLNLHSNTTITPDTSCLIPNIPTLNPASSHTSKEENITLDFNISQSNKVRCNTVVNSTSSTQKTQQTSSESNILEQKAEKATTENKKFSFKVDEKSTNVSRMNVSKVNSTTDENEFEDELDLLLSLDSKQTTKQLNQDVDKSEATNDLEHDTSKQIEDTVQGTTDTTAKPIEKKEEDLEDWLDSVLG